jgi:hypothetical protein
MSSFIYRRGHPVLRKSGNVKVSALTPRGRYQLVGGKSEAEATKPVKVLSQSSPTRRGLQIADAFERLARRVENPRAKEAAGGPKMR